LKVILLKNIFLFLCLVTGNVFSQIELKLLSPGTETESNFRVTEEPVILHWQKIPQAKSYSVYIAEKENEFYKLLFNSSKNAITDSFFIAPQNLIRDNSSYRWNVKAILYSGKTVLSKDLYFATGVLKESIISNQSKIPEVIQSGKEQIEPGILVTRPAFNISWSKDKRKSTNIYVAKKIGNNYKLIWKSPQIPSNKYSFEIPAKFLSDKSFFRWNAKIVDSRGRKSYSKLNFFHTDFSIKQSTKKSEQLPAKLISPGTTSETVSIVEADNIVLKFISDSAKNIISVFEISGAEEIKIFVSDTIAGNSINYQLPKNIIKDGKLYYWSVNSVWSDKKSLTSDKFFFKTQKKIISPAISKPSRKEKEEIFLELKYSGVVAKTINAIYEDGIVYLPLSEIFTNLEIDSKFELRTKTLTARNVVSNKSLIMDINKAKIVYGDSSYSLKDYKYFQTDFDLYFPADFFDEVIDIQARVDMSNLIVQLNSDQPLPILGRKLREGKYGLIHSTEQTQSDKVDFERVQKYLNFGFVDYQLSHTINKHTSPNGYYNLGGGGEIFGGDVEIRTRGNLSENKLGEFRTDARWQYVFKKNKYISAFSAGTLNFEGLQYTTFDGISITNSPIEPRTNFGKIKILDRTEPNYTVELYLNNQLIDVAKSDAIGNFSFDLPLNYGTTMAKLKYFGPFGEYFEKMKVYQTPLLLLQKDELRYDINVGRQNLTRYNLKSFITGYGITDWLTSKIGFEHLEAPKQKAVVYNSTSARLFDNYFANFSFSPNNFYNFNLDALFASQIAFDLSFDKFFRQGFFNQSSAQQKISAHLFYPVFIKYFQLNAQSFYSYTSSKGNEINDFSIGANTTFSYFSPSINYHLVHVNSGGLQIKNDNVDFGFNWSLNFLQQYFNFIRGSILTSRFYYNLTKAKSDNYSIALSSNIGESGRFQISYSKNLTNNFSMSQLSLVFYFQSAQFSSSISTETFSNSLIGSIGYDFPTRNFTFYNRNQVGRSGAAIRFYIDRNSNGIFDKDEEIIKNAKINISVADIKYSDNGMITVYDLNPYTNYEFQIREESIKNPLLISEQKTYSFMTEPNSFKSIDIPFYIASEISGKVFRVLNNVKIPIAGLKIHLRNSLTSETISLNTFADGSYYYFGLIPGKYKIYADEEQLKSIGLMQTKKDIEFVIESKANGDMVENLDIILSN